MRVLFDITHPAQAHFFKHAIAALRRRGDEVAVTSRDKDVTLGILGALGIEHLCLSRRGSGLAGLGLELLVRYRRLLRVARRFRPQVLVARMGITIGPVGALLRIPRVVFEDTEHARLQAALSLPFATVICTGTGYLKDLGRRQLAFDAFPVLAYLAPEVFRPDPRPLAAAGLDPEEPIVFLRLISWQAAHDAGVRGAGGEEIRRAIERLSAHGRVVISAEGELDPALQAYGNPLPVEHVHHLLAHARLCIGESNTMAAEAAVLGTPAIFTSPLHTGYLLALRDRYGLVELAAGLEDGVETAERWLARPDLAADWQRKREAMLAESEDVNAFMLRTIERFARGAPAA